MDPEISYPFARFSSRKLCYKSQLLCLHDSLKQRVNLQRWLITADNTNTCACHVAHTTFHQLTATPCSILSLDNRCVNMCVHCAVSSIVLHHMTYCISGYTQYWLNVGASLSQHLCIMVQGKQFDRWRFDHPFIVKCCWINIVEISCNYLSKLIIALKNIITGTCSS